VRGAFSNGRSYLNGAMIADPQIIIIGEQLAADLNKRADKFHPKSYHHEELSWEAIGIETRIKSFKNGDIQSIIQESEKSDLWEQEVLPHNPDLGERVVDFYKNLYLIVNGFCKCDPPEITQKLHKSTCVVTCEKCGQSAATTYFPNYLLDETEYTIFVKANRFTKTEFLSLLRKYTKESLSYLSDQYDSPKPVPLISGTPEAIHTVIKDLQRFKVTFFSEPPYPHATRT
jgi:hypothetical protein